MIRRTAIVLHKSATQAEAANASAIIMADLSVRDGQLIAPQSLVDLEGHPHARIRFSVAVLKSKSAAQLWQLVKEAGETADLIATVFTRDGMRLNNSYDEYARLIGSSSSENLEVIAIGITGEDGKIRALTRKFSSYG